MKILLVCAVEKEMEPFRSISQGKHTVDYLVSGPGMIAAMYSMTKLLTLKKYDFAINSGIAGSFNRSIRIGEVVNVVKDVFSEIGAEDDNKFLTLSEMGLDGSDTFYPNHDKNLPCINTLREVSGITVNTVHGNENSISGIIERLNPDIETMEGAAFFYVCGKENLPCIQLRGISNYVEKRNRNAWNIPLALKNLTAAVKELLNEL